MKFIHAEKDVAIKKAIKYEILSIPNKIRIISLVKILTNRLKKYKIINNINLKKLKLELLKVIFLFAK